MSSLPPWLPRPSREAPPTLSLFRVVTFLFCIQLFSYGSKGTQNACNDLLKGTSTIKAMLHNGWSDKFFLVTSSGDVFIEPISNFNHEANPPTIDLTKAKYRLPTTLKLDDTPFTIRAKPDQLEETWLLIIEQNDSNLCFYPKLRLEEKKPQVENVDAICCNKMKATAAGFWLTFNSLTYGMVTASKGDKSVYTNIYSFFSRTKPLTCNAYPPSEKSSWSVGYVHKKIKDPAKEFPECGFIYSPGDVAVLAHKSIINVYRNVTLKKDYVQLKEKQDKSLPEPKKYTISQFIKCQKTEPDEIDHPNENPDKPPDKEEDLTTDSQGRQLANIMLGLGVIVLVLIGVWFLCKYNWDKVRPRKRKSKPIGDISKALAEWSQKASTPPPGKSMAPIKTPIKTPSTPRVSAIPQMLKKVSKLISHQVTPPSTTPATTTSSPLTRRVSHTSKNPSKTPISSPAESTAPRCPSKAKNLSKTPKSSPAESPAFRRQSNASPVRPSSSPVGSRKVTKKLDSIKKSLVKSLAPLKSRKKRK